jgi:hypothetical protein
VHLTLDSEDVRELLFDLLTAGYRQVADREEDEPVEYCLSARWWPAARALPRARHGPVTSSHGFMWLSRP